MAGSIKWLELARNIQSIARAGLTYTENKYDIERYQQLLQMSKDIVAEYSDLDHQKLDMLYDAEDAYLTPKVDIRGVVFRDDKILMVKETIDGKWSLPGGWADVGFSPSEVAEKEVFEESGLKAKAVRLLAVLDKKKHPHPEEFYYVYKMFFLCEEEGGDFAPNIETSETGFFALDELPELSEGRNTRSQIEMMFRQAGIQGPSLFD